jgi:hypothetical protein
MPIFKACTFSIKGGLARCREEQSNCDSHRNGVASREKAPRPTVILLKVNVNEKWEKAFIAASVPVETRSFGRAEQLERQRVEVAEAMGRDPYAVRQSSGRDRGVPEDVDTGCPVFGNAGLAGLNVSLSSLSNELHAAGFVLTQAMLLKRFHKPPTRLVLEFTRDIKSASISRQLIDLCAELTDTVFNQVDVWANPRQADGRTVHTVNCGKRDDSAKEQYRLSYADGDWDAIPVCG